MHSLSQRRSQDSCSSSGSRFEATRSAPPVRALRTARHIRVGIFGPATNAERCRVEQGVRQVRVRTDISVALFRYDVPADQDLYLRLDPAAGEELVPGDPEFDAR